jgi:hypothetical protein
VTTVDAIKGFFSTFEEGTASSAWAMLAGNISTKGRQLIKQALWESK